MKTPRDFSLIPGCEIDGDFASVPEEAGIYLIFLEGGMRLLEATDYFVTESDTPLEIDGRLHLYTGAATDLRKRLIQHFRRDAGSSSLRKTLLSIECAKRAVSKSGTEKCAVTDEKSLSTWLFRNCLVAVAPTPYPFQMERILVEHRISPFNITLRRKHRYSQSLMEWRNAAFPPWRPVSQRDVGIQ